MSDLAGLQGTWEQLAKADPMWAVLMNPDRMGRRWTPEEFFLTGEREVATVMAHVREIGVPVAFNGCALDFGCGVGRLTQALASHFAGVVGIDISPTMVKEAERYNRHGERCRYVLNSESSLRSVASGSMTFVYSSIVLQHMKPAHAERYIAEFARVLAPGGVVVFQIPDALRVGASLGERAWQLYRFAQRRFYVRTRLRRALRRVGIRRGGATVHEAQSESHSMPEGDVRAVLASSGLDLKDVQLTNSTDENFDGDLVFLDREPTAGWVSKQYCAVKQA